jgi:ATP-binding cassette subfamily B protein
VRGEPQGTVEPDAQPEDASEAPFDPYAYYYASKRKAPRTFAGLVQLSRSAVGLAREASPRLFAVVGALQLAVVGVIAMQVLLGKIAIERILGVAGDTVSLGAAIVPLVGLVVATAADGLISASLAQLQRLLGERVARLSWSRIVGVTTSVRLETFESSEFFDALQRVKTLAVLQPLTLTQGLFSVVSGLLGVLGVAVALALIAPVLLPILLVGSLPLWLIARRAGRIEFDFSVRLTQTNRLRAYLTEVLTARQEAKEIRAFSLQARMLDRWAANYSVYLDEFRRHARRKLGLGLLSALVTVVVTAGALGTLLALVAAGSLELASAGAALIAVRMVAGRVQQVFSGVSSLFESSLFLHDFFEFLDRRPDPQDDIGDPVPGPFSELRAERVGFRYPGSDRDVLRDVSLTIRAGEVVALVGENGSGKTTLAKLLAGMFEPSSGRVLWDDRDVRQLDREGMRDHVGVIFQDFVRYQLSARENIGFGREQWLDDTARIEEAARQADAYKYLAELPAGFETGLGKEFEGGVDLSGGQWQRVALARGFFRDAGFLVLDEPTASLDARSEYELFERVSHLAAGRSVLLISHRFSTVKGADRILVIHEGELIEQGTHDELMGAAGLYAELFELQARSYR